MKSPVHRVLIPHLFLPSHCPTFHSSQYGYLFELPRWFVFVSFFFQICLLIYSEFIRTFTQVFATKIFVLVVVYVSAAFCTKRYAFVHKAFVLNKLCCRFSNFSAACSRMPFCKNAAINRTFAFISHLTYLVWSLSTPQYIYMLLMEFIILIFCSNLFAKHSFISGHITAIFYGYNGERNVTVADRGISAREVCYSLKVLKISCWR